MSFRPLTLLHPNSIQTKGSPSKLSSSYVTYFIFVLPPLTFYVTINFTRPTRLAGYLLSVVRVTFFLPLLHPPIKNLKVKFFKILMSPRVGSSFFTSSDGPSFPLYWTKTRSLQKIDSSNACECLPRNARFALCLIVFPRLPTRKILSILIVDGL